MEELTGFEVTGDHHLLRLMKELTQAKREYDKVAEALASVRAGATVLSIPVLKI